MAMPERGPTPLRIPRRAFVVGAAAVALPRWVQADALAEARALLSSLALDDLNSFGPVSLYFQYFRRAFFEEAYGRPFVERLWEAYARTHRRDYGEWALHCMYFWWRTLRDPAARIRNAQAGYRMAAQFARDFPKHPVGHVMAGIFVGAEGLTRGVLNALQLVPEIKARLTAAVDVDPGYMYGLGWCVIGKLYVKVPSFPMSIGDLDKAEEAFAKAEPYAARKFAPWYVFKAELVLQRSGRDAAFALLDEMEREVKATNVATAYLLDSFVADGRKFRAAVDSGKYDKYTWDPVLEPAERGLELIGK